MRFFLKKNLIILSRKMRVVSSSFQMVNCEVENKIKIIRKILPLGFCANLGRVRDVVAKGFKTRKEKCMTS